MELIIIKTKDRYIRVKPDQFLEVNLDKASVYPMDQLDRVRELEAQIRDQGFEAVSLKKLVLTEEELS